MERHEHTHVFINIEASGVEWVIGKWGRIGEIIKKTFRIMLIRNTSLSFMVIQTSV